jgi:adenosylmethionine---8-amino-7-oxononanoate aminotransferase
MKDGKKQTGEDGPKVLAALDQKFIWHPFTQMQDWLAREPIVIESGHGAILLDTKGREYIDANSSIWTNLHGHQHPAINRAINSQLKKIAHSSALGLANEPASLLAEKLCTATRLSKVFFSDDGSTAMEVALKLSYEYARRARGLKKPRFLCLQGAYHGDTVGAVSLGHIDLFHKAYSGLLFESDKVMAPYCYRCPFNRAKPERADARTYRKCKWECVGQVEKAFARRKTKEPYAAFVVEPLIQGAAGMGPQPSGWLRDVSQIARAHGAQHIADEVMTGFQRASNHLLASHQEAVQLDFAALAKGMTGGYLPMAATLTTQPVFDAFLGRYEEFKTFFHGHSFTGNQLGAAAALASLQLLENEKPRRTLEKVMAHESKSLWDLDSVGDIRQVGAIMGIELVRNWRTREPFQITDRAGIRVCEAMAKEGVLTRPIGNVIVIMPPFCTTQKQVAKIFHALGHAIRALFKSPA